MTFRQWMICLPAAAVSLLAAPLHAQPAQAGAGSVDVTLRFSAQVNGQPFECGKSYANIGSTKATITPSDFRLYVSEVALLNTRNEAIPVKLTQDGVWQLDDISFLDFENGTGPCRNGTSGMNATIRGAVPAGEYRGLAFTVGIPFSRNHGDASTAGAPLNSTAMFWSWQGGYRFLKFDASTVANPAVAAPPGDSPDSVPATGFSFHLGSTQCASASATQAPASCKAPNRLAVKFDEFDPVKSMVLVDIGAVLANANVTVNARRTSPGCMSFEKDADCVPVMNALGLPYDGRPATGVQKLFSVQSAP